MANFAELDDNNIVTRIVYVSNEDILDEHGAESEQVGIAFCNDVVGPGRWIQTSYNGTFRKRHGDVGHKYDPVNDVFIAPQPAAWFTLNENFDWVCPDNLNPKTGMPYTDAEKTLIRLAEMLDTTNFDVTYDKANDKWVYDCKLHDDRKLRTFHIWNAKQVDADTLYPNACSSTNYVIQSMEEVTHGTDSISNFVVERPTEDNSVRYNKIAKHFIALDLAPIALITYQEFPNIDGDLFAEAMKIHPQAAARNIDELFRLIVEWAWSYTDLGNTEPMAELCHNILRAVQMPANVRQDLLALRPQPVARFLSGDPNALREHDKPEPTPGSFKTWISDTYQRFKSRRIDSPLNLDIDKLPLTYPV